MNKKQNPTSFSSFFFRISLADRILFAKHLSMMARSGMPLVESIKVIQRQVKSRGFAALLNTVIMDLENGQSLSMSLEKFKHVFGELFINIIKIGEVSGSLVENLEHLAAELKKSQELYSKITSALVYPIIILLATLGVSAALIFIVLPKIIPIFTSLGAELPATTKALIAITNFIHVHYILIGVGSVLMLILVAILLQFRPVKYAYQTILFLIPVAGTVSLYFNIALFARTLAFLLQSGIKIIEAITITTRIIPSLPHRRALEEIAERVKRGEFLYIYLEQNPRLFPSTLSRMIEVGERTGNLATNLFYLADFYESELDEMVRNLSSILEPLLLLMMGGVVAFVALSIITPIYQVTQAIH